jgi:hypothetical protein
MGLYTSVHMTPVDSTWVAPVEMIRAIADVLRVTKFDHFSVSREIVPYTDPAEYDDDRYDDVFSSGGVAVDEALQHHRAGSGYRTFMMFPFGNFMQALADEVKAAVPESLAAGYIPWDTGIYNGRWSAVSYEEGIISDVSSFAFCLHASGCPSSLDGYLQALQAVKGINELKTTIESLAKQPFKVGIELS